MTIKVDLLPNETRGFQLDPLVIVLVVLVLASAGAFYYYGQTVEKKIAETDAERVKVETQIKQDESVKKAIEVERQKLAKLDQQFQLVKNLMHDPLKFANIMSEVGALLPDAVFIDNLNIEPAGSTVSFAGTASGALPLSVIAATMKNLNDSAYFDGVNLQSANRKGSSAAGGGEFAFSLSFHYDATAATEKPPGTKDVMAAPATAAPAAVPGAPGAPGQ